MQKIGSEQVAKYPASLFMSMNHIPDEPHNLLLFFQNKLKIFVLGNEFLTLVFLRFDFFASIYKFFFGCTGFTGIFFGSKVRAPHLNMSTDVKLR